jgi:hypothetical protein
MGSIGLERALRTGWPGEEALRKLVIIASGLFIWAVTTCCFIREGGWFVCKRLDTILKGSSSVIEGPENHLNEIYLIILTYSILLNYSEEEKEEACDILKHTLRSIIVLLLSLFTSLLSKLLQLPKARVEQTFKDLCIILDILDDLTCLLRLYYPLFCDFLLNKDQCEEF